MNKDLKDKRLHTPIEDVKKTQFDEINHESIILDIEDVKKRNEANKDYSKMLQNTRGGMGRHGQMYLGNNAKDTRKVLKRILKYIDKDIIGIIAVMILTLVTSGLAIMIPWLFKIALDEYILNFEFDAAITIAIYIAIISVSYAVTKWVGKFILIGITQKVVKNIRQDAFDNLQKLPVKYYDTNVTGDISSKLANDVDLISNSMANFINDLLASVITIIGSLVMMFVSSVPLSLIVIIFIPIMFVFMMTIMRLSKKQFTTISDFNHS